MAVTLDEPRKSPQDKKLYRRLRLDNGLDVLLINDPEMQAGECTHANGGAGHHDGDEEDDVRSLLLHGAHMP